MDPRSCTPCGPGQCAFDERDSVRRVYCEATTAELHGTVFEEHEISACALEAQLDLVHDTRYRCRVVVVPDLISFDGTEDWIVGRVGRDGCFVTTRGIGGHRMDWESLGKANR